MAFVICQPCIGELDRSCIDACPTGAIHPTSADTDYGQTDQSFIDPVVCTNCAACVDACPVNAIFPKDAVPQQWQSFIEKNARHFR